MTNVTYLSAAIADLSFFLTHNTEFYYLVSCQVVWRKLGDSVPGYKTVV